MNEPTKPFFRVPGDARTLYEEEVCDKCRRPIKAGGRDVVEMTLVRVCDWLAPAEDQWVCPDCAEEKDMVFLPTSSYREAAAEFAREVAAAFLYHQDQSDRVRELPLSAEGPEVDLVVSARAHTVRGDVVEVRWGPRGELLQMDYLEE